MKNKYQRMTKTEKKELKQKFYETTKGKEMKKRLLRLRIIGLIGILFSVFLVISGYISKELNWATWTMSIILMLCSCVYFMGSFTIKGKILNDFAIKNIK
ncbi:hypothetical protein EGP91_04020 [bacterium]|nr:hypothetical protein [bacterium]